MEPGGRAPAHAAVVRGQPRHHEAAALGRRPHVLPPLDDHKAEALRPEKYIRCCSELLRRRQLGLLEQAEQQAAMQESRQQAQLCMLVLVTLSVTLLVKWYQAPDALSLLVVIDGGSCHMTEPDGMRYYT